MDLNHTVLIDMLSVHNSHKNMHEMHVYVTTHNLWLVAYLSLQGNLSLPIQSNLEILNLGQS